MGQDLCSDWQNCRHVNAVDGLGVVESLGSSQNVTDLNPNPTSSIDRHNLPSLHPVFILHYQREVRLASMPSNNSCKQLEYSQHSRLWTQSAGVRRHPS